MIVLGIIVLVFIAFYFYSTKNHDYWKKRNIKHDTPIPLFGNNLLNQFGYQSTTQIMVHLYNKYSKEKVIGYFVGQQPTLIIRDPDIARSILNVDFYHFYERGLGRHANYEYLMQNLFHAEGDKWKLLRQRITPAFTTAKLKSMFPLIIKCAEKLQIVVESAASKDEECDVREIMARFTTEFIGACGFGIEMNTINTENSMFRDLGKAMFTRNYKNLILTVVWEMFPEVRKFLHLENPYVSENILEIVTKIVEQRGYKPIGRNDFVDLLLELKNKGKVVGESIEKTNSDGTPLQVDLEMDLECIAAQVFIFFAAGFETSSSATSYTLHELAFHPEIQKEIQEEIDQVLIKYDNKLCYEAISELSLLDMAFKESMRIFPSLGFINRVCVKRYTIPELDITIDPGVMIIYPIQAVQTDEKYFVDANKFNPKRFANKDPDKFTYLPFGEGPRACIGARLGQMQSLAGLASFLQKFTVEPGPNTRRKPLVNPTSNVVQAVKNGIPLKVSLRKKKQL